MKRSVKSLKMVLFLKMTVLMILLCGSSLLLRAQEFVPGIKGGINGANLSNSGDDTRVSGHIGLFLHHRINNHWCFQPELLYSGEGEKYNYLGQDYRLALNYLRIPLMFQYYPVSQVYFEFGPQLGYLLSAREKGKGGYSARVYDGFHKADFGLNLGAGVRANRQVGFYFRYTIGLSDTTPDDIDHYTYANRVAQLGVDIRLK